MTLPPTTVLTIALEEQRRARSVIPDLGECPVVLSRATTQFGSFNIDRRTGEIEIRISRHIDDDAQVRETARHELAHQAAWERYRHFGHGHPWRMFATYLGCEPVSCARAGLDPEILTQRQRYVITCTHCGTTSTRQRRCKLVSMPWRYACARCRGSLVVAEVGLPTSRLS